MKARNALLPALAAGALMFAGASFAQDSTGQTPPPQDSMQQAPAPTQSAAPAQAPSADVTVRSVPPAAPQVSPPPPFSQLSGGKKWITEEQAASYPPLANDFLNASHHGTRVSKAQYEAWVKQVQ
ncbi:MAG: hypothetical protein BGP10_11805 [Rhodanobacter sp. 68-29]|uniref:hypothetical protein n=1 Tax=Rhodanobacter sp. PCA2 TaxID=2006117 RepID=UPI00086F45A0|nr:hypothetical protein [Rhodanobacter sp. PCA2]MBA2078863.1 hypothetical protein [Rhodanobacter sp. PCA2]MBN8922469.1 hypothetical protein [Rhodanobacter sp.]ODU74141.1 MAG: hypothetical protein ABT17_09005 [Rhodanobacter sp. SCN 69-32]OJY60584.1 MAG: hypothetical protein BGP10_11805 [Rhodanobacter sp. 68-29]